MTDLDLEAGALALTRACEADSHIWPPNHHDASRWRRERDQAVLAALSFGLSPEQIADELGVLISDVQRMAAAARRV